MANLTEALGNVLTTEAFMSNITTMIPIIGGIIVFSFTYRIVRKVVKGAQKGKANI